MKYFNLFLLAFLAFGTLNAQDTIRFNYQGIALNANNIPIANTNISVRTYISGSMTNSSFLVYEERRLVNTDANGYFDFQIGSGGATYVYGSLKDIVPVSGYEYKISTYLDPAGGSNYTLMGVQPLASVPYAVSSLVADSLRLPFKGQDNSQASIVINNFNTGASTAITGSAFANHMDAVGIAGTVPLGNTAGTAIRGRAFANGAVALEGINNGGVAIRGKASSANGVAVLAENTNTAGKALDVNGNVRIAGGNTSPGVGKVLTSDATGNATWKDPVKVAFKAKGEYTTSATIQTSVTTVVPLQTEQFDIGADYNTSTAATDPNSFIAPVNGVYHFSGHVKAYITSNVYNISSSEISLLRNGSTLTYLEGTPAETNPQSSVIQLSIDQTVQLNAGDKIQLAIYQYNSGNISAKYLNANFSGHLVFAL